MAEVYLQRQTVSVLLEKALVQLSPNDGSIEEAVRRLLSTEVTTGEHGEYNLIQVENGGKTANIKSVRVRKYWVFSL